MAWDIASATYVSTKDVSAQDATPVGLAFSGDGTKMFLLGFVNTSVFRYDLSTAWDPTTATYVSLKNVSAQDAKPYSIAFSSDGTIMFMIGVNSDSVHRYDLSTAWDITSASYVSAKNVSAQESAPDGVVFSPDGTKMFVVGFGHKGVYRYDLSTAWDPTTATYVSTKNVSAQDTTPIDVALSGDGTIMFMMGINSDAVHRYDLSAPWDITTASYVSAKNVSAQDAHPLDVAFSPDGTNMFVVGNNSNSVYRYTTGVVVATGASVGTFTFTGTAAGSRSSTGASVGTFTFTGTAAGRKQMSGTATTGTYAWVGASAGTRPARGSATGAHAWDGEAVGSKATRGSATGTYSWVGASAGTRSARGSSPGSFLFVSVASGTRHPVGTSVGVHLWDALATGTRNARGASTGAHKWDGTGKGGVLRNLTFTAHIAPSRITAQINRPAWAASVEAR